MSDHTENLLPRAPYPPFDIRISAFGFAEIESWNHANVNLGSWLLYWNRKSGAALTANGMKMKMNPSDLFLIPPYTTFSTESRNPFQHLYFHFDAGAPFDRVQRKILRFPAFHAAKCLPRLLRCRTGTARALAFRLLVYDYLLRIPETAFLPPGGTVLDARIRRAVEIMNQEFASLSGNLAICRRIGMSANNFYRLFQHETGTTPKHYLLNQRMEAARRLLIDSGMSIEEIAAATGYADRYHFSKAFRRFYSCPPVLYRNRYQSRGSREFPGNGNAAL